MPWLIDGSNVLGADRHSDESKRALVRLLAQFARAKRTRVTCVFDGPEPHAFATHLGSVTVVFSGGRTADEVIIARAATGRGWSVVTSDRGLAARVAGRHVEIVESSAFLSLAEAEQGGEEPAGGKDWEAYFSDPKNRLKF